MKNEYISSSRSLFGGVILQAAESVARHRVQAAAVAYITMNQLAQRYSVSRNTIGQWVKKRPNDFPMPIQINGRNLWDLDEIEAWDRALVAVARKLPTEVVQRGKRELPSATYVQPAWARPKEER